jgi:uncharacterized phage-associated protein
MCKLSVSDLNKLGNSVVYIAQRIPQLSKTKLLKLLYLMEEYSVVRFRTPFLGLPFEVWQAGPVAKDVFIDLSETPVLLNGYVDRVTKNKSTYIVAKTEFCDDEFSDNDIQVMDDIIRRYGQMSAKELVEYTHKPDSLWYSIALEHHILEAFQQGLMNNSDYVIDLSKKLQGCNQDFYREQLSFLQMRREYETSKQN